MLTKPLEYCYISRKTISCRVSNYHTKRVLESRCAYGWSWLTTLAWLVNLDEQIAQITNRIKWTGQRKIPVYSWTTALYRSLFVCPIYDAGRNATCIVCKSLLPCQFTLSVSSSIHRRVILCLVQWAKCGVERTVSSCERSCNEMYTSLAQRHYWVTVLDHESRVDVGRLWNNYRKQKVFRKLNVDDKWE